MSLIPTPLGWTFSSSINFTASVPKSLRLRSSLRIDCWPLILCELPKRSFVSTVSQSSLSSGEKKVFPSRTYT